MMMSCMRYFHQELLVMAAIRPMSRFISEAPEAFLQNNTPSLKLLAILPYCLASGEGQGAAYMLPALVQLSQFMSAIDIKRNFDRSDQPVMYVSHTLKNVVFLLQISTMFTEFLFQINAMIGEFLSQLSVMFWKFLF